MAPPSFVLWLTLTLTRVSPRRQMCAITRMNRSERRGSLTWFVFRRRIGGVARERRDARRLGCACCDGRRGGSARGRFLAERAGASPGAVDLRPLCQGARFPGRLSERVAADDRRASGRRLRLD